MKSVALSILVTLAVSANALAAPVTVRDKWALLIGVDGFQDPSVPSNKENGNNVVDLAATLKDSNAGHFGHDHVLTLTGDKATKCGIEQAINGWLEKKALPDDLVLVYISSASIQGPHGEPMVFSYDTLASEPELSGIDVSNLASELKRRIQSRNIIMFLDTTPAGRTAPDFAKLSEMGITIISATSGNQRSINNGAKHTSLFEEHLSEAIRHGAGTLTLQEVFDHISSTVQNDAERAFSAKQTPVLAIAKNNSVIDEMVIGVPVKSSTSRAAINIGHPLDQLALSRPDIITPRSAQSAAKPIVIQPSVRPNPAKAAATTPGASPKSPAKPPNDDDDDDDDKPRPQVDFQSYMAKMKQDIQKNWKPPKGLETRRLVAVFTITRDGRIRNPSIVEGSGVEALDKSALDALAATTLDPLPPGSPRSVDIKYKFDWNVRRE